MVCIYPYLFYKCHTIGKLPKLNQHLAVLFLFLIHSKEKPLCNFLQLFFSFFFFNHLLNIFYETFFGILFLFIINILVNLFLFFILLSKQFFILFLFIINIFVNLFLFFILLSKQFLQIFHLFRNFFALSLYFFNLWLVLLLNFILQKIILYIFFFTEGRGVLFCLFLSFSIFFLIFHQ